MPSTPWVKGLFWIERVLLGVRRLVTLISFSIVDQKRRTPTQMNPENTGVQENPESGAR